MDFGDSILLLCAGSVTEVCTSVSPGGHIKRRPAVLVDADIRDSFPPTAAEILAIK